MEENSNSSLFGKMTKLKITESKDFEKTEGRRGSKGV